MKIGFIGLGNVGRKLAGNLLNNKHELVLRDIKKDLALDFINDGAEWAESPKELAELSDIIITCLPSPEACSKVMEDKDDGILYTNNFIASLYYTFGYAFGLPLIISLPFGLLAKLRKKSFGNKIFISIKMSINTG